MAIDRENILVVLNISVTPCLCGESSGLAAYKQSVALEQHAAQAEQHATQAEQRVAQSEQHVAELSRVLDETAASYQELQQTHAATLDALAWYKRWAFGRKRERFAEGQGQGHLFDWDLDLPAGADLPEPASSDNQDLEVRGHRRRRKKRKIDWDKLPQVRHDHALSDEEKSCSCCGRPMDRIGEDVTRELEYQPPKLEAYIHVRPQYACRRCKDGVRAAPLPPRPIPGGIAGPGLITEVFVSKFDDRQQRERADASAPSHWTQELAVPGQRSSRSARGCVVHNPRRCEASSD